MNKIQKLIFIFLVSLLVLVTISFFLDTKKSNKNEVVKYKVVYNLYNNIKNNNVDTSTRKYISKLYGYSNDNSENIIMFTKEAYVENNIIYDLDGKELGKYNSDTVNKVLDNATLKKYSYIKDSKEYKLAN
mgnify:FL=1